MLYVLYVSIPEVQNSLANLEERLTIDEKLLQTDQDYQNFHPPRLFTQTPAPISAAAPMAQPSNAEKNIQFLQTLSVSQV